MPWKSLPCGRAVVQHRGPKRFREHCPALRRKSRAGGGGGPDGLQSPAGLGDASRNLGSVGPVHSQHGPQDLLD
eukprot:2725626-Pyramimonas_sp.AAC.1